MFSEQLYPSYPTFVHVRLKTGPCMGECRPAMVLRGPWFNQVEGKRIEVYDLLVFTRGMSDGLIYKHSPISVEGAIEERDWHHPNLCEPV